jgi:hypothetical protein
LTGRKAGTTSQGKRSGERGALQLRPPVPVWLGGVMSSGWTADVERKSQREVTSQTATGGTYSVRSKAARSNPPTSVAGSCPSRCISELAPGIQLTHGANSSLVGTSRHRFCNTAAHWTVNRGVGERSSRAFVRSYRAMAAVLANMVPRFLITERASKALAASDPLRPTIALPRLLPPFLFPQKDRLQPQRG